MMRKTCGKSAPLASMARLRNGRRRVAENGRKNAGEGMEPTTGTSKSRQSRETSSAQMKTLSANANDNIKDLVQSSVLCASCL